MKSWKMRIMACVPAVTMTLSISFLFTLYGPLELYFTNMEEFPFDFPLLLPVLLRLFLLMTAAGFAVFAISWLIHRRLYDMALGISVVVYLCSYIQGMYLAGNLPPLDGTAIDWSVYMPQHLLSVMLWLGVAVAVLLLTKRLSMEKMKTIFTACGCFLTAVLAVTLITVGLQNDGFAEKSLNIGTKEQEFTFSSGENLLILVVDAVDSETFFEMMETTDPQFGEILEDFTYYPDTVGAYPFTKLSIPFILSGQWYENQEDFRTFTTAAMKASPLLNTLRDRQYRMGLYEEEIIFDSQGVFDFENVTTARYGLINGKGLMKEELRLVWFKYAPYPLKPLAKVDMERFFRVVELVEQGEPFRANNQDVYEDLKQAEFEIVAENCFRFFHIEGAHVPFRYDKAVNLIPESQGSYEQNIQCSMTIVGEYLTRLKEAGVYDNSAIILMADHGYGHKETIPVIGRGNPLLAVKGRDERHPLQISHAPISYEDLQQAYQRLLDGESGDAVFDAVEGQERSRRFLTYFYEEEEHIAEYQQTGKASDSTKMEPTGKEFHLKKPGKKPRKEAATKPVKDKMHPTPKPSGNR